MASLVFAELSDVSKGDEKAKKKVVFCHEDEVNLLFSMAE